MGVDVRSFEVGLAGFLSLRGARPTAGQPFRANPLTVNLEVERIRGIMPTV